MCTILVTIAIMFSNQLPEGGHLKVKQFSFSDIKKAKTFTGYYMNQMTSQNKMDTPRIQSVGLSDGMDEFDCNKFIKGE